MQTQVQQMSKKNKVTVPFYSPPSRLYGQTPAEIIKEARAAVMNTSTVGIKPVFTSRPFTPKEKERTLFGNLKKRNDRPPSSFSLRNINSQEAGQRVKLPSIEIPTRKKTFSTFHYSNNLSLDNLTEDYDAEALEEVEEFQVESCSKWKKSHSCPKEGRMIKAASFNELSHRRLGEINNNWGELKKDETIKSNELFSADFFYPNENLQKNQSNLDSFTPATFGDGVKVEKPGNFSSDVCPNLNMTRGGGDFVAYENSELNFEKTDKDELVSITNTCKEGDLCINTEHEKYQEPEKSEQEISKEEESKELKEPQIKTVEAENKNNEEQKEINKKENFSEKSVETGFKSEYLTGLQEGYSSSNLHKQSESVPLEILQLYETARYYGVDVDKPCHAKESTLSTNNNRQPSPKIVEDYFGETPKEYLTQLKENFNSIGEKIKDLNVKINEKNFSTKGKTNESNNNVDFEMNNKKRYHTVTDKSSSKEKAYTRWNKKQESNNSESGLKVSDEGWDLFWKNSYFKSKDDDEKKSEKETYQETLRRLVNKLAVSGKKGNEKENIYEVNSQLYDVLKKSEIVLDSKFKSNILKVLYFYADNENPEVLLSIARVLLFIKADTSLPMAFKIIFKVARFDSNDHLFLNEEDILELFLDGIGRSSPLECAESCIYGYGALKFLTMNYNILSRILHLGALDLMTLHLKMINAAHDEKGSVGEQTQHALFQLTGALRHVAAGEGALPLFLTTNCVSIMCKTLQLFSKDDDVVTNISRTLSLLSTDESVTQVLVSVENFLTSITNLIEQYKESDKILIRLAYCLGNIVEHSDLARVQLSRNDVSLAVLLNVLKFYIDKDLEISMREQKSVNAEELNAETVDDIIVKIIRIVANMSMNPIVGSNLSPTTNNKKSLQLSQLLSVLLLRKDPGITLLATLGCLNNISYYCNSHSVLIDITQGVERVLGLPSEDCQAEAARVLGNLTRHREIRDLIYNTGGVNQLIKLLQSQDQEVVRCACGTLVNMMLDSETRKHFVKSNGIDKLVKALELFSNDWSLASLAARAIWNSCADDLSSAMAYNNLEHLSNILANSLEEENWNDGDTAWEEFASIATDLLERINVHLI